MFHENDFELTKRLEFLQKMGEKNPFIKLTYAALLIREKRFIEADKVITEIIQKIRRSPRINFMPSLQMSLIHIAKKSNGTNIVPLPQK